MYFVCLAFLFYEPAKVPKIFNEINAEHQRMYDILLKESDMNWIAVFPPHISGIKTVLYFYLYNLVCIKMLHINQFLCCRFNMFQINTYGCIYSLIIMGFLALWLIDKLIKTFNTRIINYLLILICICYAHFMKNSSCPHVVVLTAFVSPHRRCFVGFVQEYR